MIFNMKIKKTKSTIPEIAEKIINRKHKANITGSSAYLRSLNTLAIIKKSTIANISIKDISSEDLQKFFYSLENYSNSYITKIFQLIKISLDEAIRDEIIFKNPILYVIKPKSNKQDKKISALTLEQHKKFVASLEKEKYKNIFLIAINTGMRVGEILALTPDDIDLKNQIIKINKTITRNEYDKFTLGKTTKTYAGTREIPFDDELKSVFINAISNIEKNEFGLLFSNKNKIINPSTLNTVFKRICKNLNFEGNYNFHMLRHTFATRCIESGMPAHVLQKLLGHTDISITLNTYTSIFNQYKKEEFDKFLKYKKANHL